MVRLGQNGCKIDHCCNMGKFSISFNLFLSMSVPLKMDASTTVLVGSTVARMCTEMDLLKKFLVEYGFVVGTMDFWQEFTYAKGPKYCSKCLKEQCLKQGHDQNKCKIE